MGDFLKFCKDFKIPVNKDDQIEVYRRRVRRIQKDLDRSEVPAGSSEKFAVSFPMFIDILCELFFVKDVEDKIMKKTKEIQILSQSALRWSLEKKDITIQEIEDLKLSERDPKNDDFYLWSAHEFLRTSDTKHVMKQMKSVHQPFGTVVKKGEKVESTHEVVSRNRFVESPRTGIGIVKQYDEVVGKYFAKKQLGQRRNQMEIAETANQANNHIQANRSSYSRLASQKVFKPQGLSRDDLQIQSFKQLTKERAIKRQNDKRLSHKKVRSSISTNWGDVKKLDYRVQEEREISNLLGIEYQSYPFQGRPTKGGGGNVEVRKDLGTTKLEQSRDY